MASKCPLSLLRREQNISRQTHTRADTPRSQHITHVGHLFLIHMFYALLEHIRKRLNFWKICCVEKCLLKTFTKHLFLHVVLFIISLFDVYPMFCLCVFTIMLISTSSINLKRWFSDVVCCMKYVESQLE